MTFDESSGTRGSTTQSIYVGVADKQNTVYRSTDGGTTWSRVAGQPTGFLAHKGVLDATGHTLYIATSDTGGPYDGAKGDVWKMNTTTGVWTRISPIPSTSADDYFGYSGLTIDRQHPGTLIVASQLSWWPDTIFFRSTDSGATWSRIWDFSSYPSRTNRYTQDITSVPWLSLGANPSPPETAPKVGWMNESVEIDPFNSDKMLYGTGATIYGTDNLTAWDTGGKVAIKPVVAGLGETAVLDLISPPTGAPLISGLGDIGGFRHTDLTKVPATMFQQPYFTTTTSLDYAETNPAVMVRAGNFTDSERPNDSHVAFSTDGGANWFGGAEPAGVNNGGTVAAAADGSRFVWSTPDAAPVYSVGFGTTWTAAAGLPRGARVESDRADPRKFYGFAAGRFYVSSNGGATFTASAATGLPDPAKFAAVAGRTGDVWLAGTGGLWHSTDSGTTFTKLPGVTSSINIGFGKAAPGRTYPALYAYATVDGINGVFRSDDTGASWVRINDDRHQYGNAGGAITGDPRVYGRVYLGTNGRGILYADRTGGPAPTTPPATTPPVTTPPVTTPPVTTPPVTPPPVTTPPVTTPPVTTPPATTPPAGGCAVTYTVANQWPGGFQGSVRATNRSGTAITGWTLRWSFPDGQVITQSWNGTVAQSGAAVTVTDAGWNRTLAAGGGSAEIGFQAGSTGTNGPPTAFTLNGVTCAVG